VLRGAAVVALALLAAPAADNLSAPVPPARVTQVVDAMRVTGAAPALPWPDGAQSAVGATGFGVLAASPGAHPLPTASVAKVMTALVTLEQRPLRPGEQGPAITITNREVQDYQDVVAHNGSYVPVVAGETLTERQALEALMLPSANNVAILLARWISGSVPAFVSAMNARAAALGLTQTRFADSSGFDPATVSVPADLVRLGQRAMTNPLFAQVVDEQQAVIPVAGTISNVNTVLGHDGVVGIKTGNSDPARAVYLAAATYQPAGAQPLLVYASVQGLDTLSECFAAAQRLVDAVRSALRVQTLVQRGQVLGRYATAWGATTTVVAGADLRILLWPGTTTTAALRTADLRVPARAGATVGRLEVSAGGGVAAVPASLDAALADPSRLWLLTRTTSVSTLPPMTLLTWLSLSLAVAAVLLVLAMLVRTELQGPHVRLRLVSRPAHDAWRVSADPVLELSGACVALLTNGGSRAGAAWDFRVAVSGPRGPCRAVGSVVAGSRGGPDEGAPAAPEVVNVEPRSSLGLVVRVRLPLDDANVETVLPAQRGSSGDLRLSVQYGATRWPLGRPTRRSSKLSIPQSELAAAVERWRATAPAAPAQPVEPLVKPVAPRAAEPPRQRWVPPERPRDERPAEKPAAPRPVMEKPAAGKPAVQRPAVERPAAERPAVPTPVAERPVAEKPAAEETAKVVAPPSPGGEDGDRKTRKAEVETRPEEAAGAAPRKDT
jgi:serine-type D-Ala-D-Ala carboxypeptidase (penicillin-binding protein 5/6)